MSIVLLFDRKKGRHSRGGDAGDESVPGKTGGKAPGGAEDKSAEYMAQARAILLEANVSGADVREGQELFKKALAAQKSGDYGRSIELAMECIDIVDDIMKNG